MLGLSLLGLLLSCLSLRFTLAWRSVHFSKSTPRLQVTSPDLTLDTTSTSPSLDELQHILNGECSNFLDEYLNFGV